LESDLAGQSLTSPSITGITVTPPEEADLTSADADVDESDQHLRDILSGTAIPLVPMIPPPPQERSLYQTQADPPQREEGSRTPPPRQGVLPPGSPPTLRRPAFAGLTPPEPGYIPALRHSDVYGGGAPLQAPDAGRFEQMRHSIAGNEGVQQFEPPPREAFTSWRGGQGPPEAGYSPPAPPTITAPAPAMPGRGNTLTVDTFTPPRAVSLYDSPVMPRPSPERPMSQYELGVAGTGAAAPPVVPPRSSARFSHLPSRTASGGDSGGPPPPPSPLRQQAFRVDGNAPSPSRSRASSRAPSIAESRKDV